MRSLIARVACATVFLLTLCAHADYFTDFVWFRVEPDLSRIVLSLETIRGRKPVDHFIEKKEEYARQGKYWTHGDEKAVITRKETLDGHVVESKITIFPAPGRGLGGAVPRVYVEVFVDGVKKIDCPLGSVPPWFAEEVTRMVIHTADEVILVSCGRNTAITMFEEKEDDGVIIWDGKRKRLVEKSKYAEKKRTEREEKAKKDL